MFKSYCGVMVLLMGFLTQLLAQPANGSAGCPSTPHFSPQVGPDIDSDLFAWQLFAYVNTPDQLLTKHTLWETWARPGDLYCDEHGTHCNPKIPPAWPQQVFDIRLERIIQLDLIEHPTEPDTLKLLSQSNFPSAAAGEDVRMNCATFEYIVQHNLWYLEGQEQAFVTGQAIDLPTDSIEVKAYWIHIDPAVRDRYHWQKNGNNYFGLLALNITSKLLPQWFWTTFEHVDNPKRCHFFSCKGEFFGKDNTVDLGIPFSIRKILKDAGLTGNEWLNYRLKGSQFYFTDSQGRPTLLGNSILEASLPTSSCITCHARSTVNNKGEVLAVSDLNKQSYNGSPQPCWFEDPPGHLMFLPRDFVWSFLNAHSTNTGDGQRTVRAACETK